MFQQFSNFFAFILGGQFLLPQVQFVKVCCALAGAFFDELDSREGKAENGKMDFSQPECGTGFLVPGAFKLDHLHPAKPILFVNFPIFAPSYWRANSYYPREGKTENGKIEFSQPESESGISVPGAFKLDHLQPVEPILFCKFSNFCTFILEGQFLLPQRGEDSKWENGTLTTCSLLSPSCFVNLPIFALSYWRANSY